MPRRGFPPSVRVGAALALALAAAGCTPGGQFDPTELFNTKMFDNKKPLQGQREDLFPSGVPGAETGVPPDLVKGYQPPPDQSADNSDTVNGPPPPAGAAAGPGGPAAKGPVAAAPVAAGAHAEAKPKPKPKPKPKVARVPDTPPRARIDLGSSSAKPQQSTDQSVWPTPQQAAPSQAQSPWPAPQQAAPSQAQSPWPAPQQAAPSQAQSVWPNPPARATSTQ